MSTVNLEEWHFAWGGSPSQLKGTPFYKSPTRVSLATHVDLLRHVAADAGNDAAIQNQIGRRLKEDPVVKAWQKQRVSFQNVPHFTDYRESERYDSYHAAAIAVSTHSASAEQSAMVQGLNHEIKSSSIMVSRGQVLFHGRGDRALDTCAQYPSFISTSLDPIVSCFHATKRKLQVGAHSQAFIYALTLTHDLPAIWGNGGKFEEWELLLETQLSCVVQQVHVGSRFTIVEATLGL